MSKIADFNQIEVHIGHLARPMLTITYLGETRLIKSFPLWDFIASQRLKMMKKQKDTIKKVLPK